MRTTLVPPLRKKTKPKQNIFFLEDKSSTDWNSTNCAKADKHGKLLDPLICSWTLTVFLFLWKCSLRDEMLLIMGGSSKADLGGEKERWLMEILRPNSSVSHNKAVGWPKAGEDLAVGSVICLMTKPVLGRGAQAVVAMVPTTDSEHLGSCQERALLGL